MSYSAARVVHAVKIIILGPCMLQIVSTCWPLLGRIFLTRPFFHEILYRTDGNDKHFEVISIVDSRNRPE